MANHRHPVREWGRLLGETCVAIHLTQGRGLMGPLLCLLLAVESLPAQCAPGPCPAEGPVVSYLYQPAFCMDYALREPAVVYVPQPGDIFLCTGCEMWAKLGHWAALTGAPQHSGIVFAF